MPQNYNVSEETNQLNHSGELEDLLGRTPGWLLNSGMTMIAITSFFIVSLSWFIQYPDQVTGRVILQTHNPPIEVFAPVSSVVDSIMVINDQWVEKGDYLLLLESTSIWQDIKKAHSFCKNMQQAQEWKDYLKISLPLALQLGEVQTVYAALEERLKQFQKLLSNENFAQKIEALEIEKGYLFELNHSLKQQEKLYLKELDLIKIDLERAEGLTAEGVISQVELEKKESFFLQGRRQAEQIQSEQIQNLIRIEQLESKQIDLREGLKKELEGVHQALSKQLQQCQASLVEWEKKNLFVAPISGYISLSPDLAKGSFVKGTNPMLTVVPDLKQNTILAQIELPVSGIGKIQRGNTIQISLEAYPEEEYGLIEAEVSSISRLPQEIISEQTFIYQVRAEMSLPLTTSYNKSILFQQKMTGQAKIITENRRLLHRLLDKIFQFIK